MCVACEEQGRDPSSVILSVGQVLCCGRSDAELARRAKALGTTVAELPPFAFVGSPAEVVDKLGTFAEAGAQHFYLQVLDLADLDHLRLVAEEVLPQVRG